MDEAFNYVIKGGGIAATASYGAYRPQKASCSFDPSTAAVTLTGYTNVPAGDENALLQVRAQECMCVTDYEHENGLMVQNIHEYTHCCISRFNIMPCRGYC